MSQPAYRHVIRFVVLCLILTGANSSAYEQIGKTTRVFFSQGQAVYNEQDQSASRQAALKDFMIQAVVQAVSTFLSPSRMGSEFAPLQEKVLREPGRYVESYQIFSESPVGGLLRITGQVTVSMELLRTDLLSAGLTTNKHAQEGPAAVEPAEPKPPLAQVVSGQSDRQQKETGSSRGISLSKQAYFWAVAEMWGQGWLLPQGQRDEKALFAQSVFQESRDYGWSITLPATGSVVVAQNGAVPVADVLKEAKNLGIQQAILGTVVSHPGPKPSIEANLQVFDVETGKPQGEVHRGITLNSMTAQEGTIDLASAIVPIIDRVLHQGVSERSVQAAVKQPAPLPPAQTAPPASTSPQPVRPPQPSGAILESQPSQGPQGRQQSAAVGERPAAVGVAEGELTLFIRGEHDYANWEQFRRFLQERFKSMRVKSVDLGSEAVRVQLEQVDGSYIASLRGIQIGGGISAEAGGFDQEAHSVSVTLSRPASAPAREQAQ